MRSSLSVILSSPVPEHNMSHPDYEQTAHDHGSVLVLVKQTSEQGKHKSLTRVLDRVMRVSTIRVIDSAGVPRVLSARYVKEYPVENNDWGDFQTHRRLLGLITIGKYETQTELNELCRVHESLKVKYTSTLYDSRCILFGPPNFSTPSNFKSRAINYHEGEACEDLENHVSEFLSSLFWVLESKRLERSREKVDRVSLMLAPFERKDFVGLDLESRTHRKRSVGRMTKHLGDLSLQSGLPGEALSYYLSAAEILKAVNDWLWLGAAYEGQCAASVIALYPNTNKSFPLQRNSSLQETSPGKYRSSVVFTNSLPVAPLAYEDHDPPNALSPEDISRRYREAISQYCKYQNAGVIETEASFKAARVAIEQGWSLQAASFLQNIIFINLVLNETEKAQRFTSLAELYQKIGFHRKSSFCLRLAATRFVSAQNSQPNWSQCYQIMLQALPGLKLSLDPTEFCKDGTQGWPCLQIQLLQELVVAARRMGHSAVAIRHLTFILQALWEHLSTNERRELALQLQLLASQCEGAPVPLVLQSGTVIPPANLTNIPHVKTFTLQNLPPPLRPHKIQEDKEDSGPFLFTPIHFGSLERRRKTSKSKMDYVWVEGDPCEVVLELYNPLPFELKVSNMMLLTCGAVFESLPSSLTLPPDSGSHTVTLSGVPKETGELQVQGYSTHTLGVKSNCRLKHMNGFPHPQYTVEVISALPHMQVSTSLPKRLAPLDVTSNISLYAGECAECSVVLNNVGSMPVEMVEIHVETGLNSTWQQQVFQWSSENLQAQLPLLPGASASFTLYLHSVHDYVTYNDTDTSSQAYSSLLSGPSSLPVSLDRRTEATPSIKSGSSGKSHSSSYNSSQTPLPKFAAPAAPKMLEGQLKLSYSGGEAQKEGYCRICVATLMLEMVPSVQITHWDVLPAETSSQFYLVLDVANMTTEELELHYTPTKFILIEALETCRVPVPVDRCPLSKLSKLYQGGTVLSPEDRAELDSICNDHIASLVELRWNMPSCNRCGRIPLRGLSLSSNMLDLVRMSPLRWDISINSQYVKPQEELSANAGECLNLGLCVHNHLDIPLSPVTLEVQFYQDHQNGVSNYRLETRLASSGATKVTIPLLAEQGSVEHECCVVFYTPGEYKIDIQCSTLVSDIMHVWKLVPPVAITVIDT